jgi:mono/diheme cytochrome c family protein
MPKRFSLPTALSALFACGFFAAALVPYGAAVGPGSNGPSTSKAKLIKAGKELYTKKCLMCHAANGKGTTDAPKLAGIKDSDVRITKMIKNGKPGQMPAFAGKVTASDIKALIAYLRSLKA